MPEQKIKDFAASVNKLVVVEELDGFIETHCKNLGLSVRNGIIQYDHGCVRLIISNINQTRDTGMNECGISYDRHSLSLILLMAVPRSAWWMARQRLTLRFV